MRRDGAGILLAFAAVAGLVALGCTGPGTPPERSRLERELARYRSLPRQKAFAVASGEDGRFAYGYGYGFTGMPMARDRAIEQCNVRRASLGIEGECHLFAVGDRVVGQGETRLRMRR